MTVDLKNFLQFMKNLFFVERGVIMVDLKRLYSTTGVKNRATVFLFMDTQIVEESFVEDINNILSSGEVSNLYRPEEFEEVCHGTT